MSGLYRKDIGDISRKVILGVEAIRGAQIHKQLLEDPTKVVLEGLDPHVYSRIRERQTDFIRTDLKNKMAKDFLAGKSLEEVVNQHKHPLLRQEDVVSAYSKAAHKVQADKDNTLSPKVIFAVIGAIVTVIQIMLLLT